MMLSPQYAVAMLDWNLLSAPVSRPLSLVAGLYESPSGFELTSDPSYSRQPITFAPASTPTDCAEAANANLVTWSFASDATAFGMFVADQNGDIVAFGSLAQPITATPTGTIKTNPGGLKVRLR